MSSDATEQEKTQRVDHDKYWRIEEIEDAESEIYTFTGRGGPMHSAAVAKAKQQFARDHDYDYSDLTGRVIGRAGIRDGGAIVLVIHRPARAANEALL